ncbi:glycoside hydrolase family 5 protein, partial [Xanthomonas perforans]|nr:glycoside hydrolase family 5 protein [Xanthomonas perforans]
MNALLAFAQRMLLVMAGLSLPSAAHAGLTVSGTQLRESNGNVLV